MSAIIFIAALIVWAFLHGRVRARQDQRAMPPMLMSEPRQCLRGFRRLASPVGRHLPPLTKEDHL